MKNTGISAIIFAILTGMSLTSNAIRSISFAEAISKNLITYTGIRNVEGRSFALEITNKTSDSLCINLETGRIFLPDEPVQPQVVTRGRDIYVSAFERRSVGVNTVCGNASLPAPVTGYQHFGRSVMAHPELVELLSQLSSLRLDTRAPVQSLVWMYTNNHGIERMYNTGLNEHEYAILMDMIRRVKGSLHDPGYRVLYREPSGEGEIRFTGEPERLKGMLNLELQEAGDITIVLTDSNNQVVRMIRYLAGLEQGVIPMELDVNVTGLEAGAYRIRGISQSGIVVGDLEVNM